ncbi:antitoxin [Azorhizobium oxalatiphilum]|uniref:Antitoxin n=1 Tax=Azorhizobium oxalatiphilum TaxID=980631 RepID=A0A917FBW3_9HYPH|nr:type II toxin-antitoxin system prevent-host-death family antitoxin [Azorhizobium oxalatiphilum]GGF66239.1 antitoxin [Azorhizobium oxalatiphilum]
MDEMQLRAAKAQLSHVIDRAVAGEAVAITRNGRREAVVLSWEAYDRLAKAVPSFGWLLTHPPASIDLYERDTSPARDIEL